MTALLAAAERFAPYHPPRPLDADDKRRLGELLDAYVAATDEHAKAQFPSVGFAAATERFDEALTPIIEAADRCILRRHFFTGVLSLTGAAPTDQWRIVPALPHEVDGVLPIDA